MSEIETFFAALSSHTTAQVKGYKLAEAAIRALHEQAPGETVVITTLSGAEYTFYLDDGIVVCSSIRSDGSARDPFVVRQVTFKEEGGLRLEGASKVVETTPISGVVVMVDKPRQWFDPTTWEANKPRPRCPVCGRAVGKHGDAAGTPVSAHNRVDQAMRNGVPNPCPGEGEPTV